MRRIVAFALMLSAGCHGAHSKDAQEIEAAPAPAEDRSNDEKISESEQKSRPPKTLTSAGDTLTERAVEDERPEGGDAERELSDGRIGAEEFEEAPTLCAPSDAAIAFSSGLGAATISAHGPLYLIASYALEDGRSSLRIHRGRSDASKEAPLLVHERILREGVELARPHPPAIAWLDDDSFVAYVDESGRLKLLRVSDGQSGSIEEALDPRFSPALTAHNGDLLLAYSKSIEGTSRLFLKRIDRGLKTRGALDLTPPSQSASAPSFIERAGRPLLLAIDARLGFSPALLWDLEGERAPRVIRPISHLVEPAFLRGAFAAGSLHIVYIARGIDLSHAVGWFREGERAPEPASVVPPLGFGLLRADLAPIDERRLLIAADRPLSRDQNAARELVLRTLDRDILSEPLAIRGEDGSAARPSLSPLGEGRFALVYGTRRGQELSFISCE